MKIDAGTHALRIEASGKPPPTFVCLHGLADGVEIWATLAPEIARRGQAVVVDQRGHGDSTAPPGPYRLADLAADVCVILDRRGIGAAILVGHSMGGIVAMTAAIEHPERVAGLVLLGTASQVSERAARWYETIALAAEREGIDGLKRAIFGPTSRREVRGNAQAMADMTRCLKSLHDDPLTPKLGAIRCPVRLLVGEKDPMGPTASSIIAKNVPGADLEVVAEKGHWVHVEAPERVIAAIDSLLAAR